MMKWKLVALALAMGLWIPTPCPAEDFGKSAVVESLMKKASQAPSGFTQKIEAPKPTTPYTLEEKIPEDIDALMARVEAQNLGLIEEYEALIAKDPLNPDAPKWIAQVAEFHWQTAHYRYLRARRAWLAQLETCQDESCSPEPKADYHLAIDDYRRILANYPTYDKLDVVLFRLGDALIRNQQPKEGVSYLHRLTQTYPDYRELDAAYLAMGEFYFSQKITGTAQAAYQTIVDKYPNSPYFQYAQYKLAWTYLNLADEESYLTAIELFKDVVESIDAQYASAVDENGQIDENKLKSGEISFRNQALNDLSTTYTELDGGWKEARHYLSSKLPPNKAREKLEQLAQILDAKGKFEEEIELYGDLIEENSNHPHEVDWRLAQIEAFKQSNRLEEVQIATRQAIERLQPRSSWYEVQRQNGEKTALSRADRWISFQRYALAMASITKAENEKNLEAKDAAWADAETLLAQEIAQYPDQPSSFDIEYTYAYVIDERSDSALNHLKKQYGKRLKNEPELAANVLTRLREAARAYQKIIDWPLDLLDDEKNEQIRIAANRQVFVYANILATADPDWSIVNSAKTTSFVEEKRNTALHDVEPLSEAEQGFVQSARQYATRYPKDDETPAFLWRAAEIYRTHYDYNEAAARFDEIITGFPQHQYAGIAVGSMFELYYKAHNDAKIEFWAKWLIEHQNFKYYTAKELEDTAAFAIDKQAVALAERGDFDAATSTLMRIESSFPKRLDLITAARFKAARFQENAKQWTTAIDHLERIALNADTPQNRANALFQIGMDALKIVRYDRAAQSFEQAAYAAFEIADNATPQNPSKKSQSASPPFPIDEKMRLQTAQAVYHAAQLAIALDKKPQAIDLLDRYLAHNAAKAFEIYRVGDEIRIDLSEEEKRTATPVLTQTIATLERAALDDNGAARLNQYAQTTNLKDERPAVRHQVYFQWAQYEADLSHEAGIHDALAALKPEESDLSSSELARYHYLLGRASQIAFENIVLEFPIRTLRKRIEQKAKWRQTAEKSFQKAIGYKNAQISTSSAYELARMALHFRDAFKNLPAPKELENDPNALEEYTLWIEDELIFPAEDAAASLLDVAHQITLQLQSYTPQAQKSSAALAELKPDDYPLIRASIDP